MSDRSETKRGADESRLDRRVGRPLPKLGTAAAAWSLFGALWIAGLALGHQIKAAGHDDFSGAWAVLYGGLWMLLCVEMRKAALALWTAEDEFEPNGRATDLSRDAPPHAIKTRKDRKDDDEPNS